MAKTAPDFDIYSNSIMDFHEGSDQGGSRTLVLTAWVIDNKKWVIGRSHAPLPIFIIRQYRQKSHRQFLGNNPFQVLANWGDFNLIHDIFGKCVHQ